MSSTDGRKVKTRGYSRKIKRQNTKMVAGRPLVRFPGRNSLGRRKRLQEQSLPVQIVANKSGNGDGTIDGKIIPVEAA